MRYLLIGLFILGLVGCGGVTKGEQYDLVVLTSDKHIHLIGTYGAIVCRPAMEALASSSLTERVLCLGHGE